ncbi:MAG: hypothetical protein ACKO0W_08475 [Planctomycetota bacterium]
MEPALVIIVLGASALTGLLVLGVVASRVDNARRLVELVRNTRRIRLEHVGVRSRPRGRAGR